MSSRRLLPLYNSSLPGQLCDSGEFLVVVVVVVVRMSILAANGNVNTIQEASCCFQGF